MEKLEKLGNKKIAFLQALGLILYSALVGSIIWNGDKLFGKMNNILGPILFLSLFVVSALICALISLGYPIYLFWEKKNTKEALSIVLHTAFWLALFVLLFMIILTIL